jgi:hypothetical protein
LPGLYGPHAFLTGLLQAEEIVDKCATSPTTDCDHVLHEYHCARVAAIESDWSHDLAIVRSAAGTKSFAQLEAATDDSTWASIAFLHSDQAHLDEASRALLMAKEPSALTAGRLTASKILIENPVLRQIRNLERSISEDTVRNEYLFHTKIHEWLAAAPTTQNLDAFNSKVYAELFLTPDSDPWLGLAQPDICTALENNGLVSNTQ